MDAQKTWDEASRGLAFLFWGWLALTIGSGLHDIYTAWFMHTTGARGIVIWNFGMAVMLFFQVCTLAGMGVAVVGVARLLRAPYEARLGGLALAALGCVVVLALVKLASVILLAYPFLAQSPWFSRKLWTSLALAHYGARAGGMILLVVILFAIGRRVQALLPFWFGVIVAVLVGFDLALMMYAFVAGAAFRLPEQSPFLWMLISVGVPIAENALLLLLIARARHTLLVRGGQVRLEEDWEGAADWFGSPEWRAPTRGVGLYARGVQVLLLAVFGGYGVLLTAQITKLTLLAVLALLAIPAAVLASQVLMIVGLAGYARMPLKSRARGLAIAALVAHALALLIDIVSLLTLAGSLLRGSDYEYQAQRDVARAQLMGGFGQAVGLAGFVLMILALARTARFIGAAELTRKTTPILMMVIVTAAANLLMRVVMNSPRVADNAGVGLMALAVGVAFLALTALLMFMSFVNKVHAVLVEGPPETRKAEEEAWG